MSKIDYKHYYKLLCVIVDDAVAYEYEHSDLAKQDADAGLRWDCEATAKIIVGYLVDGGVIERYADLPDWRYEEAILLSAIDWFSSFEPVLVRVEAANA